MSSINSMTQYLSYFGISSTSAGASKTGIIFVRDQILPRIKLIKPKGIYTVGQVVAFFPASYLPDKLGRRLSMLIGNCVLM